MSSRYRKRAVSHIQPSSTQHTIDGQALQDTANEPSKRKTDWGSHHNRPLQPPGLGSFDRRHRKQPNSVIPTVDNPYPKRLSHLFLLA